jgi:flagellar hook-length control protein FliK
MALTEMVRAFRRENNAKPEDDGIRYEGRLYNIRTGTFEDRVIRSYETDDNTENSESGADDAANSDNSAQTENAGANIQNQNSAQPNTNAAAANMHGAAIPQTIHVQTVRTEVVTGPTVFDPPEVQLAGRIMSMDLTVSEVQEMTVVLNPEALGEVAVKVTNQNGAVSVALSAANPETQKILADTAAALSQSLKQGGADIREVLVIAAAEAGSQMGLSLGADGFTRQPGEGQNADGTNRSTVNGIGGINDAEIEASEENAEVNYESRGARLWQTA